MHAHTAMECIHLRRATALDFSSGEKIRLGTTRMRVYFKNSRQNVIILCWYILGNIFEPAEIVLVCSYILVFIGFVVVTYFLSNSFALLLSLLRWQF